VAPAAPAHLLALIVEAREFDGVLDELVSQAAEVITPAAAGGVTLRPNGQPVSVAISNQLAARVDEIQYGAHQGPCLESLRTGDVVIVDDLGQDERWDVYRPRAIAHGVVSSLSLPLNVGGSTLGVLNLYSTTAAAFDATVRNRAEGLAGRAVTALTVALRRIRQAGVQSSWPSRSSRTALSIRPSES
jgi:GAF domain-containing protein